MPDAFFSLVGITTLLLGSPGPAPMALAATGATYGWRGGLGFLYGILTGLGVAIIGTLFGVSALFEAYPAMRGLCQAMGAIYMVYVAYKIATAPIKPVIESSQRPDFKDGFILNLLNPKAYAAFLAINSQFLLPADALLLSLAMTATTCLVVAVIVDALWLAMGSILRPVFAHPAKARVIRVCFACVIVLLVLISLISSAALAN